ncbi:hypothetical protein QYE76_071174 [Lolium multiflorum]|uniref:Reverse transcriptase/retrotransposon-derived protein RNase H-like domain-containing protein n=1 Tax=Lolium multiflorum TaxID=4521 RepID=A0AAD8SKD5_LOLMU|nr:hypothetical protein QYE76_071174 [Lolium multiflorum]
MRCLSPVLVAPDPPRWLCAGHAAGSVEVMMAGVAGAGKDAVEEGAGRAASTRPAKPPLERDAGAAGASSAPPETPLQAAMNVLETPISQNIDPAAAQAQLEATRKTLLSGGANILQVQRELNLTLREYNDAHGFASVSAHAARLLENRLKARNLDQDLRKEIHAGKSTSASVSIVEKPKYSSPDKTIKAAKAAMEMCDSLSGEALAKQQDRVRELLDTIHAQNDELARMNKASLESKSIRSTKVAESKSQGQASSPHPDKRREKEMNAQQMTVYDPESALVGFLRENRNIFAWSDDLVGVPREQSLNVRKDAKPVRQPLRRFVEDRRKIIGEEVTKLLVAGFIVEVTHTEWLANPVMVEKKKDENLEAKAPKVWRMCIDYTNLNKACPRDPFPLPRSIRLGEKALPLYALMKKSDTFVWTPQADAAFKELKTMLATTPVLASPLEREPIMLYIAATNRVVSVVVVVEREEEEKIVQRPVYYLSEVLSLSKQNYPHFQKMTYGVYMAATKLKHYFEEHPMKVVSEAPILDIMGNKDASGRIAKWAIQLSPYVPVYERRDAIKSQALADFLVDWAEMQYRSTK